MFKLYLLQFIAYHLVIIQAQGNSIQWQSLLSLSNWGMTFSSIDDQALLLSDTNANSFQACFQICHANMFCRIFDFDGLSNRCRLFEGNGDTMGSIVASSSLSSIVGSIQIVPGYFSNIGLSCSFCTETRYLTCLNSTCQCPSRTYFDGSICRSQSFIGSQCTDKTNCRVDLNMTCLPRQQCGPSSLQNAVTIGGSLNGTAGSTTDALFNPFGIAVGTDDSLFVGDYGNARVIQLPVNSLTGRVIVGTGIVGNSSSQLNGPSHLYVDASSNIYVSDTLNHRLMFWANGSLTGVSITGTATINSRIIGIAVDSVKNVYISEVDNHRITKWAPNATSSTVIAGTGVQGTDNQHLAFPFGLYLDEVHSYLYVADYFNNRIQRFTIGGSINGTTVAGGNGSGSNNNQLYQPQALCVSTKTGTIYVADTYNSRIMRWYSGATSGVVLVGITGSNGVTASLLSGPAGIALSRNESYLYVSDLNNNRIQRFNLI